MNKSLRARLDEAKKTDQFWMDSAKLDFSLAIEARRRVTGKSYTDLAVILNTSNAYISKIFRGDANLTIESMVKLARSVDCNIGFNLKQITEGSLHNITTNATANFKRPTLQAITKKRLGNKRKYCSKIIVSDYKYQDAA